MHISAADDMVNIERDEVSTVAANKICRSNTGVMLGQRSRRWTNLKPALIADGQLQAIRKTMTHGLMLGEGGRRWDSFNPALVFYLLGHTSRFHPALTSKTRDIYPLLVQSCPIVFDVVPTLIQDWVKVSCLVGGHK